MDSRLEIPCGGLCTGYCLLSDIFQIRDVDDAFNPTYLMKYSESYPMQVCFQCRHTVYIYVVQSASMEMSH